MPVMVMARPGVIIPRGIMARMTNIPIQVYGINLLVRLLPEGPADVRVHCPKGSPIRYGEVVARGDGFEEVEGHYFYVAGEEYRIIRLDAVILSFPHE